MRLLMTTDAVGGVWRYGLDAAHALEARGIQTTLAVIGPDPSPTQQVEAAGLHLVATGLPLDWGGPDRLALARAAADLAELADGYDAVQLNQPAFASLARWPAPVLAAAHSCSATWWNAVEGDAPLPDTLHLYRDLVQDGLRAATATIAPTAAFAAALATTHQLARTPTAIHNGRADPPPRLAGEGDYVRSAVVEGAGPPARETHPPTAILAVGRLWDPAKNIGLLDALAPLVGLPVHLYGAVHGPNGEAYTPAFARAHGHVSAATLTARLAERPIFASPALYEPFGLAVLEAAQAGCPLVLADIPTFRELWDGAAIFADPRTPAAWLPALSRARREHIALGQAAQARARRYTIDRMADRLAATLASLAA